MSPLPTPIRPLDAPVGVIDQAAGGRLSEPEAAQRLARPQAGRWGEPRRISFLGAAFFRGEGAQPPTEKGQRGFTLLELIIVIAIIGILAAIVVPVLKDKPRRAQEVVLKTNLRTMRDALDQFYGDKGHYPAELEELVDASYLREVPYDPITQSHDTWEVEYEEIDPDQAPAETDFGDGEGPGIIDVFSGSEDLAIDGSPYNEW